MISCLVESNAGSLVVVVVVVSLVPSPYSKLKGAALYGEELTCGDGLHLWEPPNARGFSHWDLSSLETSVLHELQFGREFRPVGESGGGLEGGRVRHLRRQREFERILSRSTSIIRRRRCAGPGGERKKEKGSNSGGIRRDRVLTR